MSQLESLGHPAQGMWDVSLTWCSVRRCARVCVRIFFRASIGFDLHFITLLPATAGLLRRAGLVIHVDLRLHDSCSHSFRIAEDSVRDDRSVLNIRNMGHRWVILFPCDIFFLGRTQPLKGPWMKNL